MVTVTTATAGISASGATAQPTSSSTLSTVGMPPPPSAAQVAATKQAKRQRRAPAAKQAKATAAPAAAGPQAALPTAVQAALANASNAPVAKAGGAKLPPSNYTVTWVGMARAPRGGKGSGNAKCAGFVQSLGNGPKGSNTVANALLGLAALGNVPYLQYVLGRGYAVAKSPQGVTWVPPKA